MVGIDVVVGVVVGHVDVKASDFRKESRDVPSDTTMRCGKGRAEPETRRVRRRTAKRGDRRNGHSRDHTDRRGLTPAGLGNTGHKPHLRSPTDATIIAYL